MVQRQRRWLESDLEVANKNRALQPWLIVFAHRPMYCTTDTDCDGAAALLRDDLEETLHRHGLDLDLWPYLYRPR